LACGSGATASPGTGATAIGINAKATADAAVAFGSNANASAISAMAFGLGTAASRSVMTAWRSAMPPGARPLSAGMDR
jgi:YadA head domain repeat (2 copies)